MNETLNILSILYGIVAFVVSAWWLRKERMDAIGVLTSVVVGLTWPVFIAIWVLSHILARIVARL